jgi:hypothetical protein
MSVALKKEATLDETALFRPEKFPIKLLMEY